jgi:SAM-dependent methyltransferase
MLPKGSIGVDFNIACVQACRNAGLEAYTPDHLPNKTFDTLLFSHVLEHTEDPETVIRLYLPHLRKTGQVVALTPQERGYSADPTHVRFLDASALAEIFERVGLEVERSYSFPLPRWAGTWLRYNEFVVTGRRNHVS